MIAKFISCQVEPAKRQAFSGAQQFWQQTYGSTGFNGQLGGWSEPSAQSAQALVLAFWQDKQCLNDFMTNQHDPIYEQSGQKDTYLSSKVSVLNQLFTLAGNSAMPANITSNTRVMHLTQYQVKPQQLDEVIKRQQHIWGSAKAVKGLVAGHLWQFDNQTNRFLIATFWQDRASHDGSVNKLLLGCRDDDLLRPLLRLSHDVIDIEVPWVVSE